MRSLIKSIRFSEEVFAMVEREAEKLGLPASDVVMHAVCRYFGLGADPSIELMAGLKSEVERRWRPDSFPQDATLHIVRHMKAHPDRFRLYQQAIAGDDGQPDEHKRAQMHRRIGRMVKRVLKARVVGRSLPLNRNEEIIETHALLVPSEQ